MSLEELLEMDAETLGKMSDEELRKHFEPMLDVTRPERQSKKPVSTIAAKVMPVSAAKQKIFDMLSDDDIDIKKLIQQRQRRK